MSITVSRFKEILDIISDEDKVRKAVIDNYDDNKWWPKSIQDPKKRLIIAKLGTQISYDHIDNYIKVIKNIDQYSYKQIKNMNDNKILKILETLGLQNKKLNYIKSVFDFLDKYNINKIKKYPNNKLINLIEKEIYGAGYKVAQCATLYIKGYHSGIMPVDRGMKITFGPCLGFNVSKSSKGNEKLRKKLENLTKKIDLKPLAIKNGYQNLNLPSKKPLTWWAHLVLVYFKRFYCMKNKNSNNFNCPLYDNNFIHSQTLCV